LLLGSGMSPEVHAETGGSAGKGPEASPAGCRIDLWRGVFLDVGLGIGWREGRCVKTNQLDRLRAGVQARRAGPGEEKKIGTDGYGIFIQEAGTGQDGHPARACPLGVHGGGVVEGCRPAVDVHRTREKCESARSRTFHRLFQTSGG